MADCTGLENRRAARYREFESPPLRFQQGLTSIGRESFFFFCVFVVQNLQHHEQSHGHTTQTDMSHFCIEK